MPESKPRKPSVWQATRRVESAIGVLVGKRTVRFLDMNGSVVMVVVFGGLTMQHSMFKTLRSLHRCPVSRHG